MRSAVRCAVVKFRRKTTCGSSVGCEGISSDATDGIDCGEVILKERDRDVAYNTRSLSVWTLSSSRGSYPPIILKSSQYLANNREVKHTSKNKSHIAPILVFANETCKGLESEHGIFLPFESIQGK